MSETTGKTDDSLREELQAAWQNETRRLEWHKPHKCKNCLFYACNGNADCRCYCGILHEELLQRVRLIERFMELAGIEKPNVADEGQADTQRDATAQDEPGNAD